MACRPLAPPRAAPAALVRQIPFDETGGQSELLAQQAFPAPHLPSIAFVIITGQMQQTVQDQYLNFHLQGVPVVRRLDGEAVSREMARSPP
jgi:hypothetical protein